jgi:hypothetical protein
MEKSTFDKLMTLDLGHKFSVFTEHIVSTVYITIFSPEPVELSPNSRCVSLTVFKHSG